MTWYIIICCLMIYPVVISCIGRYIDRDTNKIALVAACLILWFFMAFREKTVGVDTKFYAHVFSQFRDIPLLKIFTAKTYATEQENWYVDFEPGYRLYNKLLSYFFRSTQTITIANATFIFVLLYRFIKKNSPNYLLSIWLFVTLGTYQTEMNVTRNAIAVLIVYNALSYATERHFITYCTWCLIGASFHVSVLAFIPVYFVIRNDTLSLQRCVTLVFVSVGIGVICSHFSSVITAILPERLARYIGNSGKKLEAIAVGGVNAGLVCVVYWFMLPQEREPIYSKCNNGLVLVLLNLCAFGVSFGSIYAARIAALFGPYVMVFIPQMINLIQTEDRKAWVMRLIVLLTAVQYVLRMYVNNIGGSLPYSFFWQ